MKTLIDVIPQKEGGVSKTIAKETSCKALRLRSARRPFILSVVEGQFHRSAIASFFSLVPSFFSLITYFFSLITYFFSLLSSLLLLISCFILSSCVPVTQTPQIEIVSAYATSAAQPWLTELYDCAATRSVTLRLTDSSSDADIYIRVGEPDVLMTPTYQIDTEEIWIVTHRESPIRNMSIDELRALFLGQGDPSVKVWVYSSDEDIQRAFEQAVMAGRSVSSSASLAVSLGQMSDVLNAENNAVGILPRHWMVGNVRDVYSAGNVPVLAIVKEEPQGVAKDLISCLQK